MIPQSWSKYLVTIPTELPTPCRVTVKDALKRKKKETVVIYSNIPPTFPFAE